MSEVTHHTTDLSKYSDTKEQLIEAIRATPGFGRHFYIAKAILEVKGQEEVANQTKNLMKATWVLAGATIALVLSTILLVYVSFCH